MRRARGSSPREELIEARDGGAGKGREAGKSERCKRNSEVRPKGSWLPSCKRATAFNEAAVMAGVRIGRSAAYQLLRNVRLRGEAALQDGRHGHPAKLRPQVREFLETTCREAPHIPSHVLQAVLQERFGLVVSIGHLNRVRAELGVGSRTAHREKNCHVLARQRNRTFKKGRGTSPRSCRTGHRLAFHAANCLVFVFS